MLISLGRPAWAAASRHSDRTAFRASGEGVRDGVKGRIVTAPWRPPAATLGREHERRLHPRNRRGGRPRASSSSQVPDGAVAEDAVDPLGRRRHDRPERDRGQPERLGHRRERRREERLVGRLGRLASFQGRPLLDVPVDGPHEREQALEARVELELPEPGGEVPGRGLPERSELRLGRRRPCRPPGSRPRGRPPRHVEDAVDQVAEVVRELAVVAGQEELPREVAILADVHLADEEESQGVCPELRHEVHRVEGIAGALGHLRAARQPPAVDEEALRQLDAGRVEA